MAAEAGPAEDYDLDMDQLGSVAAGAILFFGGLVRGGFLGKLTALGGAALAVHGLRSAAQNPERPGAARDDWEHSAAGREARREGYYRRVDPDAAEDEVSEASEESFPASDSPSWTPTTGTG